jgi:hypothetical protein
VIKLRELAADIINEALAAVNSDVRVDHRSFQERGIDKEPTTHLGPAASEMERRGELSDRGDLNRDAEGTSRERPQNHELIAERNALDAAIERITSPPRDREDAQERMRDDVASMKQAIKKRGAVADIQSSDGMRWWQRAALRVAQKTRDLAVAIASKARDFWQEQTRQVRHEQSQDDRGIDR